MLRLNLSSDLSCEWESLRSCSGEPSRIVLTFNLYFSSKLPSWPLAYLNYVMNWSIVSNVICISSLILFSTAFLAVSFGSFSISEYFFLAKAIYLGLLRLAGKLCLYPFYTKPDWDRVCSSNRAHFAQGTTSITFSASINLSRSSYF